MKNKKVIAEINRAREMMGLELLNEQSLSSCMEMVMTVCYQGSGGQPPGTQVTYPCHIVDNQDPTQSLVGEKIQDMGAGYGQGTWIVDSVTANPTYTTPPIPAGEFTVHGAWKFPCGVAGVDCTQYGVDYDPATLDNSQGGWFLQGLNLVTNGNCQGIQNKIQQVNNISNQEKRDCRLDYLNLLLALCQSSTGGCGPNQPSPTFINTMTTIYNGTGGPSGCWGLSGNNPNSVCGKKNSICPGNTPTKECKCDWLTTFTTNNNCGC